MKGLIIDISNQFKIDPYLIYGICMQESGMNQFAARYETAYRWLYDPDQVKPRECSLETEQILQKTSIGLMQVMGGVYREYGFKGWLTSLFDDPKLQLFFGCKHLSKKIERYGLEDGIAAYNSGKPKRDGAGNLINQAYPDGVLRYAKSTMAADFFRLKEDQSAEPHNV